MVKFQCAINCRLAMWEVRYGNLDSTSPAWTLLLEALSVSSREGLVTTATGQRALSQEAFAFYAKDADTNEVVGLIEVSWPAPREAIVDIAYVTTAYRQQGVFNSLLNSLLESCKARRVSGLSFNVSSKDAWFLEMLKRNGFVVSGMTLRRSLGR